jgi:hypothetical protein
VRLAFCSRSQALEDSATLFFLRLYLLTYITSKILYSPSSKFLLGFCWSII